MTISTFDDTSDVIDHLEPASGPARPVRGRTFLLWLMGATSACMLIVVFCLQAQQPKPTEYQVKAAYLYSFGRFVGWPVRLHAGADDFFAICVLGQDPFGRTLDAILIGETIDGKNVIAKRVSKSQDVLNCRILFISSSEDNRLKEILATVGDMGVLTVSDMPQFSRRGGMIEFIQDGDRVRFEVNVASVEHAGLTFGSQLLKVASTVRRNLQPGD